MKHCTDCRFFRPRPDGMPEYGLCAHDKAKRDNTSQKFVNWLVSGDGETPPEDVTWMFANTMRQFDCGVDARLFEPKPQPDAETAMERTRDHDFAAKGQQ